MPSVSRIRSLDRVLFDSNRLLSLGGRSTPPRPAGARLLGANGWRARRCPVYWRSRSNAVFRSRIRSGLRLLRNPTPPATSVALASSPHLSPYPDAFRSHSSRYTNLLFPRQIEYKLKLVNPTPMRLAKLITQLKWRTVEGGGIAIYELGVLDDGKLIGISRSEMKASLVSLSLLSLRPRLTSGLTGHARQDVVGDWRRCDRN